MIRRNTVVVGASVGGVDALQTLVNGLPRNFPAAVFIVLHTRSTGPGMMPEILSRRSANPVGHAQDGESVVPGRIYVAPPDRHMLLEDGVVRLTRGPKENRFRPAVDALFRSAAYTLGPRVIGVVLTGMLDDGTAGLWAVKDRGGLAIVQDPEEAAAPSMPYNALQNVDVDYSLPMKDIAPLLLRLVQEPVIVEQGAGPMSKAIDIEVNIAREARALGVGVDTLGEASQYACPECHGVLLRVREGRLPRFRCHTGHAYSIHSLLSEINEGVEETIWNAIRTVEERILLLRHLAVHETESQRPDEARALLREAETAQQQMDLLRKAVLRYSQVSEEQAPRSASSQ